MTINSNNISLELVHRLTDVVNAAWQSGEMLQRVTPTTAALLNYWFGDGFSNQRVRNFHEGQRQAILNIVYLHEVLGETCVLDAYEKVIPELMDRAYLAQLAKPKYQFPKYAVKMATGTGKTWVMHALLIWQMLNARHEDVESGRYTQKFLIVAPGLIVYDRLLDAFCGRKKRGEEYRDPQTNDYYMNQEVFIPERYRDEVFSFIQNNVVTKEDGIGRKTTGDGLVALTNWHLFENQMEDKEHEDDEVDDSSTVTPQEIVSDLLPVRPGKSAGNDLGTLDRRALGGTELEYLARLKDLMVINDEAHHIHEIKRNGETEEVEWQRGLNAISSGKGKRFVQVDFSATPFDTKGTGDRQVNKMREAFSLEVSKCIYPRLGYPSHGGGLEKAFIEFLDKDAEVERFLKINESGHSFAVIFYVRKDGLMATYHPDFIVATTEKVYLIETKGDDKVNDGNVLQKQTATIEWIKKVNALDSKNRMNRTWEYVLVGESVFYSLSGSGVTISDICNQCRVSYSMATGNLFDL